jgi:hypothetical protein
VKISEVLDHLRSFTDYIGELGGDYQTCGGQALTKWDYVLGVYGPTPVLHVRGSPVEIFSPLQAIALGWAECHVHRIRKPSEEDMRQILELSEANYDKLDRAIHLIDPWHKQLRADLIAACGMPNEAESNWFKEKYEQEYAARGHRR